MRQSWGKLLFMHWPLDAAVLRPYIPAALTLDTFDGTAWIGVIPFTMWDIRLAFLPPLPGLSRFHELNVRTYVTCQGEPGVWFFSLDAASLPAVWGARLTYHLPYFHARMSLEEHEDVIDYASERIHRAAPPADFSARWRVGAPMPTSAPGTLLHFLTERYCLYAQRKERLYRARIHHDPWPLRSAALLDFSSSMMASHGLTEPETAPLLHYAEEMHVDIWWPERLD